MTASQRRNESRERNAVERHAELVAHGWRSRVDGRWRSPDPDDRRAWTTAAAWTNTNTANTTQRRGGIHDAQR
jgi:hypothetical protein